MVFKTKERQSWKHHVGQVLVTEKGYRAIDCETCDFIHIIPLPTSAELQDYYEKQFYEDSKPDYFIRAAEDRLWLNIGYDTKLDMIEDSVKTSSRLKKQQLRILDVGSGPGHFLLRAKERGWAAVGLEASPAAVEYSRGIGVEVHHGFFFEEDEWGLGDFDAIHMQHVLEHVSNPVATLQALHGLLKPSGVLCLEVPNDFSPIQELLFKSMEFPAWWVAPPEHLNYFSKSSLDTVLRECLYDPVAWTTAFPIELALVLGFNYVADSAVGRQVHEFRKSLELSLVAHGRADILRHVYDSLLSAGLGRQLIVVARH